MALGTETPNTREDQDSAYNPGQLAADEQFNGIAKNYHENTADPKQENDNISNIRDKEAQPSYSVDLSSKKADLKLKGIKKKGPLAVIIGVLFGGGGLLTLLFSPGIAIVQFKEALTDDLNDQLAAMDVRTGHVFRARLSGSTSGLCRGPVTVRCKFSSMSQRQLGRLQDAGFKIKTADGDTSGRRVRPTAIIGPDGTEMTASNFRRTARSNIEIRSALAKAYNPKFMGFADKRAFRGFRKVGIDKAKKLTSASPEAMDETVRSAGSGEEANTNQRPGLDENADDTARQQHGDASERTNQLASHSSEVSGGGVRRATRALSSAVKGIGVMGVADSACSVYNAGVAVSNGAKAIRAAQLARYAMLFLGTADAIKAGDATPEEVEYIGNKLTEPDMRQTIVNGIGGFKDENENPISDPDMVTTIDNPNYGKTALDSAGYKLAAHGDVPNLTASSAPYMVGGGMGVVMTDAVLQNFRSLLGQNTREIRRKCAAIQSWGARGASLVAGIFAAAGTFGVFTGVSVAASLALGFAQGYFEAMLADLVAGVAADENTSHTDVGDAAFAGTSATMTAVAQSRGLQPLPKDTAESYLALSREVKSDYIAMETYEARSEPFNVYSQYSFTGRLARTVTPLVSHSSSTLSNITNIVKGSVGSIISSTNTVRAATNYDPERFNQCDDDEYNQMELTTDVFCNLRFGLNPQELQLDSSEVVEYMISNGYIDADADGEADIRSIAKQEYATFIDHCVDRQNPYGDTGAESGSWFGGNRRDDWISGGKCSDDSSMLNNFRVFTIDHSINQGMDDEPESGNQTSPSNDSIDLNELFDSSTNVACNANTNDIGNHDGYRQGNRVEVKLCALPNLTSSSQESTNGNRHSITGAGGKALVNSRVSGVAYQMIEAMKADGLNPSATSTFRTHAHQQELQGGPNPAARPGYSNHQMGLAIDFRMGRSNSTSNCVTRDGRCTLSGDPIWEWLEENASRFNFKPISNEFWHWEVQP